MDQLWRVLFLSQETGQSFLTFPFLKEFSPDIPVPAHRDPPPARSDPPSQGQGARDINICPEESPPRNSLFLALRPTPTLEQSQIEREMENKQERETVFLGQGLARGLCTWVGTQVGVDIRVRVFVYGQECYRECGLHPHQSAP